MFALSALRVSRESFRWLSKAAENPFIAYTELKKLLQEKANIHVIDVREPHEYSQGAIPTAVNIPCKFFFFVCIVHSPAS
jgi:3-mercaptopyruvate sulfurtransferase SseA